MAKIIGIEYMVSTLDGEVEVPIIVPADYPIAFQLSSQPELWKEIVRRHQVVQEKM